ncbi:MAG: helix-turn-helix transcriptional regulator [Euryarchaeota archaeon]|nr:helix-turn-helix transcriptional regulator [Euryarchaeota archaeon]
MVFEIRLMGGPAVTDQGALHETMLPFLNSIGYMPAGYDPRTGVSTLTDSVPYRLFADCFLGHLDRVWSVGELARELGTSIPTVYRHLDKLSALDILGQGSLQKDESRKGYFIRYHDLSQAWRFTEVNIELSLAAYRRAVDAIQRGVSSPRKPSGQDQPRTAGAEGEFSLRVVNRPFDIGQKWESLAVDFLGVIEYLPESGPAGRKRSRTGVPFRLLVDCLLRRPEQGWTIDELSTELATTKPTVYRNLHKLGRLGILEKSVPDLPGDGEGAPGEGAAGERPTRSPARRRYRIRRGNLSKAWNATEWYAGAVVKNYRRTVDEIASFGRRSEGKP